ncbi:MAG: hypothetical protein GXC70_12515 [Sphingomonadaceae bacterium]|nr:hypothetical protein [Sphingomonadaceae bacterium]
MTADRTTGGAVGRPVRIMAWAIVVSHAIGAAANAASLLAGDPRYAPGLWLTFMGLKLAGLAAGVLLLRGHKAGAWLFPASLLAGAGVALAYTGPYPLVLWVGAAMVLLAALGGFVRVLRGAIL